MHNKSLSFINLVHLCGMKHQITMSVMTAADSTIRHHLPVGKALCTGNRSLKPDKHLHRNVCPRARACIRSAWHPVKR